MTKPPNSALLRLREASFNTTVLHAKLPALVCFGMRRCASGDAMRPMLAQLAAQYSGELLVATIGLEHAPLLVESYGIDCSPTLLAFHAGEPLGRVRGFLPAGLFNLFARQVLAGQVRGNRFWYPLEEQFEDLVLIPMLEQAGLRIRRQVSCSIATANSSRRGSIDLLVYADSAEQPCCLIECKRLIANPVDLHQAVQQASAYANSLALARFAVATPGDLWIYQRQATRLTCIRHLTGLELHQYAAQVRNLLIG